MVSVASAFSFSGAHKITNLGYERVSLVIWALPVFLCMIAIIEKHILTQIIEHLLMALSVIEQRYAPQLYANANRVIGGVPSMEHTTHRADKTTHNTMLTASFHESSVRRHHAPTGRPAPDYNGTSSGNLQALHMLSVSQSVSWSVRYLCLTMS